MSKQRKTASGKRGLGKKGQNFRFTLETIRNLETAARQYGMSKTVYVELALKDRFRKDGI